MTGKILRKPFLAVLDALLILKPTAPPLPQDVEGAASTADTTEPVGPVRPCSGQLSSAMLPLLLCCRRIFRVLPMPVADMAKAWGPGLPCSGQLSYAAIAAVLQQDVESAANASG
jgi:hypothetical protein